MKHTVYSFCAAPAVSLAGSSTNPLRRATGAVKRLFILLWVLGLGLAGTAHASHFRYGDMSWRVVQSDASGRTIEFKVSAGWALNTTVSKAINIDFGDATGTGLVPITYTNINGAYQYGTGTLQHTYSRAGNFKAVYTSAAKISNLQNNANGTWYVSSVVNVGAGNNSPVATVPAVVNMPIGLTSARFIVAAADPDGRTLSFRLANNIVNGVGDWYGAQPAGLSINAQTGELTFITAGKTAGLLYNAGVVISNGRTEVLVDFIIQTVQQSNPPVFDYSVTPANQRVINTSPGQPVTFSVKASCVDAGSTVRINAVGVPAGTVISPAFGAYANPIQHSFAWTPAANQFGTFVVNFVAESNVGAQTSTSVSIIVSLKPRFDVPPTPATGVDIVLAPGQSSSETIQASSADPADLVRIINAQEKNAGGALGALPAGAGLSPLPTGAANPTSGTFSWMPAGSSWGEHAFVFTAAGSRNDQMTHEVNYLVNTVPVFTSTPVTRADVGQPYSYSVSVADPDLAYGDAVDFLPTQPLPSWLTLTVNRAAGTAVLSGTPPASAAGTVTVYLQAEDVYHHSYPTVPEQQFTITVYNCTVQAVAQNVSVSLDASGAASVTAAQVNNGSTASCGIASVTVLPSSFTCANTGTNPVTLTVTDVNGNVGTATATVTVTDTELPTISAPAAVSVSTDAGQCTASNVLLNTATAADNCSAVVTNNAPATFAKGTTTVTWTATDASGNVATATQVVVVNDTENPTISAPAAKVVSTDAGQCSATGVALGNATAGDNCTGAVVANNAPATFPKGVTTVTWTATDASGNVATATQLVTVNDTERPVLSPFANLTVSAPATQCGAVVSFNPTATDNCAGATVVASPASGSTFAVGNTTVSVTATDASGNTRTGSFTVTVNDVTAPTAITRNVTVTLVNGTASVTPAQINNNSTDACGIASISLNRMSFTCANIGSNSVTLTVTDVHGLTSTASAVVNVTGSIPAPAIAVTPASSVYTGGVATNLYLGYGAQSATLTASGGVSYVWSPAAGLSSTKVANPAFTATSAGTFTYTVTATNQFGCTATASITLRVIDARCDKDKVIVCHNGHEICISPNAVPAHLTGHTGDQLGACTTAARGIAPVAIAASGNANELSAYPNPANEQATVSFRASLDGKASVTVYNEMGQRVASLYDGTVNGGQLYSLTLNSQNLATGLYQCQLVVNGKSQMLRLLIAR